jgi:hypothetical protein
MSSRKADLILFPCVTIGEIPDFYQAFITLIIQPRQASYAIAQNNPILALGGGLTLIN